MSDLNVHLLRTSPKKFGPQRRKHDGSVFIRLPSELRQRVQTRAGAEDVTLSQWIRKAMRAQLRKRASL